jgi:flagellar hook-associated protein 2
MGITVDGIVSGMDTTALIGAMVSVYTVPKAALEKDIDDIGEKIEAIAGLNNRLEDLEKALEAIEDEDSFKVYKATYGDTDAFEVTTSGDAISGTYDVEIAQLARAELEVSQGFSDKSSTGEVAEGTLSVTYAGTSTEITVDSSNSSLEKLAAEIDAIDGLTAYVLDTGAATDPYKMVVQGNDTGADNTIAFDTSGLTVGAAVPSFTENRSAQDSSVDINGITVTGASNSINDAIPGLDIELYQTTSSAAEVTVGLDREEITANVQAVIDAHGEVVSWVNTKSAYNADLGIQGPFVGETAVGRIMRGLQTIVSNTYSGGESLDSLAVMGIKTQSTGKLSIDSEVFDAAMDEYLDDVVAMFTSDDGFSAAMKAKIDVYIDPVDGSLVSFEDSLEDRIDSLETQVSSYEYRIERYEARLRTKFSTMEAMLGGMQGTSNYLNAYLNNKN